MIAKEKAGVRILLDISQGSLGQAASSHMFILLCIKRLYDLLTGLGISVSIRMCCTMQM